MSPALTGITYDVAAGSAGGGGLLVRFTLTKALRKERFLI